jgi:signal transduction histidine kinase
MNRSILADPISLEQILDNLISNAIKFSQPGGMIQVELETLPSGVRFSVRDNGPGLTMDDHQRLFQKYGRLSARPTGNETSTGLGLYITRQLVEQMSGTIIAEANEPAGTSFQITLPAHSEC